MIDFLKFIGTTVHDAHSHWAAGGTTADARGLPPTADHQPDHQQGDTDQ